MQGLEIKSISITSIDKEEMETTILGTKIELAGEFELVRIDTSRGRVECRYYNAKGADKGVIMVGGVGGDFDTPANNLYPRLCNDLKGDGISSLRVQFRNPIDLTEAVIDVLVGIEFLRSEKVEAFGLIGHSFGGAVVVQAAFNEKKVRTLVTLSTQGMGIAPISLLPESTSVLLIHGEEDKVLAPEISEYAYDLAHEPKRIKIYDAKAGHSLNEVSEEVYLEVKTWLEDNLRNVKSPEKLL